MIYYHGAPGWTLPHEITQKLHDLSLKGRIPGEYKQFLLQDVGASQFLSMQLVKADLVDFDANPDFAVSPQERKGWSINSTQGLNLGECTRIFQLYFAARNQGLPSPRAMYSVTDLLLVEPLVDLLGPNSVPYFSPKILGDPAFWTSNKHLVTNFEQAHDAIFEDRAVCEAVLRIDGSQLEHCSDDLRSDKELVETAMANSSSSVKYATMELMSDDVYVWSVLERYPELMRFVGRVHHADLEAAIMVTGAAAGKMKRPDLLKFFSRDAQIELRAALGLEPLELSEPNVMGRAYKRQCTADEIYSSSQAGSGSSSQ